jgi:hypothetical protein
MSLAEHTTALPGASWVKLESTADVRRLFHHQRLRKLRSRCHARVPGDPRVIEPRILEVRTRILKKNDEVAREMRVRFLRAGVLVINMVSSPGTGKTALLKETLARLVARGVACAAVVGNLETDNDARRLAESGAPVR